MIEARGLTKRYGPATAVDDLTFTVRPGAVTGFLGPNGAGKSTTMRMALGLDRPTAGEVLVDGTRYGELRHPLRTVGALLDARWVHPNRSARSHLRWIAASNAIPERRVDEVLDAVGLTAVARKRAGTFSLGMSQRLGIAGALLGDPEILLFDEPVNGLDPEGILWIRRFMQQLAAQGRTVFVSSHLLSEMALTATELVVIGRGRLITHGPTTEFVDGAAGAVVTVRSPQATELAGLLRSAGLAVAQADGALRVTGAPRERVGEIAAAHGMVLHELATLQGSLEEAFMELTGQSVEYAAVTS
ncbi:ABC transporter ATP-binding protein [Pseudonocardia sp.]|uniref:ABC transporter ATP-binding protein n=1 Tax=Pseudonocardia sp. TaxID=60912 RepID=UPI002608EBE5|nr:ABC transporter ATP-binding protein [Pseudonocardia sp.]